MNETDRGGTIKRVSGSELERLLAQPDLTLPEHKSHAIGQLYAAIEQAMLSYHISNTRVVRGAPIVEVVNHYDRLLFPGDAGVRSPINSRYVDDTSMLRGHSAAIIPPILDEFVAGDQEEVLLVCPGICFRSTKEDKDHVSTLHQVDIWYINRGEHRKNDKILNQAHYFAKGVVEAVLPGWGFDTEALARPDKTHPYLSSGFKLKTSAYSARSGITVLEGGVVSPLLLDSFGLGESAYGVAVGVILERSLALRKNLPDVRLIKSEDPAIAEQMTDLLPYTTDKQVYSYNRDISISISPESLELVGERLGNRATLAMGLIGVESSVLGVSSYESLPEQAKSRYGMTPDQVNAVIRLSFQFETSQTRDEINRVRDEIYAILHEGSATPIL